MREHISSLVRSAVRPVATSVIAAAFLVYLVAIVGAIIAPYWKIDTFSERRRVRVDSGSYLFAYLWRTPLWDRVAVSSPRRPAPVEDPPKVIYRDLPSWVSEVPEDRRSRVVWSVTWRFGWPLPCVGGAADQIMRQSPPHGAMADTYVADRDFLVINRKLHDDQIMTPEQRGVIAIPVRVYWVRFLVNTCVFAAAILLFWMVGIVIKRRDRAKNRCANCKYNLDAIIAERCPECGTSVKG